MLRLALYLSVVGVGLISVAGPWTLAAANQDPGTRPASQGQQVFTSLCAACHGMDGRGGERAPNLTASEAQRLSDGEISRMVRNGIPGTAMPAFRDLQAAEISAVVAYVRTLQGEGIKTAIPGDPGAGKSLFFGKAECSTCHMAGGKGGFVASDLSDYTRSHSPDELLHTIQSPNSNPQASQKLATVVAKDGRKYTGLIRNEDNFSLQLQSLDGSFHFFDKSELWKVGYASQPLMPINYASRLTRKEMEDIVSYIIGLAQDQPADPRHKTVRGSKASQQR